MRICVKGQDTAAVTGARRRPGTECDCKEQGAWHRWYSTGGQGQGHAGSRLVPRNRALAVRLLVDNDPLGPWGFLR